ncbi:MAG: alpha/beta hydrolase [Oscillospiraceae bacterium]|nr:alpha/beta hydrolase [Oscillospiraceae bacterium]
MISVRIMEERARQHQRQKERMANGRDMLFREGLTELLDQPYLPDGDPRHRLDLIRPETSQEKLPVIIEIHGGGYVACEKDINHLHARAYAQLGFAVINGDYTLHPEGSFTEELHELAAIVDWVDDHAEQYGLNAERIFMSGDSAGGHLVLLYAMLQGDPSMAKSLGVRPGRRELCAVAATCPLFRLTGESPAASALEMFAQLIGPEGEEKADLEQYNVLNYLAGNRWPPVIVITTPGDALLYEEDRVLEKALADSGGDYAFCTYESRGNKLGHVFNVLFPEYEESMEANRDIAEFFFRHSEKARGVAAE